ncbi:hypothetical protein MJD09_25420, partial [bacterium]|nr:hypothetical protein [bacterium]
MKPELIVSNRKEWRSWLKKNHAKSKAVWLVYFKKHTGKPCISYIDSVEEAICFGWIDGLKKKIDDQCYTYRFTPRRPGSKWSPRNLETAQMMIDQGKMTRAGLDAFSQRETYDEEVLKVRAAQEMSLPLDIEKAFRAHKQAWENFTNLAT